MSETEQWTIGRLLTWTTDYLREHGADSPRLDAELLLASALQCERIELYTSFDQECDEEARAQFRKLVASRAEGKPVAYLLGHREFYSLSFEVTPDVLIPRPETELLVMSTLDLTKKARRPAELSILDIGTGSGAVVVTLAKYMPEAHFTATDISPAAIEVARRNSRTHQVEDRIEFVKSDLFESLATENQFDIIVSNPPYIAYHEKAGMDRAVYAFEPEIALFAGEKGTELIERMLNEAGRFLKPNGRMLIELSPTIHESVCQMAERDLRWTLLPTIYDLARHPRIVSLKKAVY
jgi:release factor glutamine methyltransferase